MELPPLPFDVIVLYPYQGMHIGELDILERDRIHVSEVLDPAGWWVGTNVRTQQTGLFPSNYIRLDTSREFDVKSHSPHLRQCFEPSESSCAVQPSGFSSPHNLEGGLNRFAQIKRALESLASQDFEELRSKDADSRQTSPLVQVFENSTPSPHQIETTSENESEFSFSTIRDQIGKSLRLDPRHFAISDMAADYNFPDKSNQSPGGHLRSKMPFHARQNSLLQHVVQLESHRHGGVSTPKAVAHQLLRQAANSIGSVYSRVLHGRQVRKQAKAHLRSLSEWKRLHHRNQAAKELLSTEKSYFATLDNLVQNYLIPIRNRKILSDRKIAVIFGVVESLRNLHEVVLQKLEEAIMLYNTHAIFRLGEAFRESKILHYLKIYVDYVNNYSDSISMLDHCLQTKKKFVEFLRDKYAREPSLDLSSLLIQPIQRIPRYELLFSDIIRSSETEYLLDAPALHQCLSLVQEIARLVNDRKRETDELRKLSNLQKEFPCIRNFIQPHRRILDDTDVTVRVYRPRIPRLIPHATVKSAWEKLSSSLSIPSESFIQQGKELNGFDRLCLPFPESLRCPPIPCFFTVVSQEDNRDITLETLPLHMKNPSSSNSPANSFCTNLPLGYSVDTSAGRINTSSEEVDPLEQMNGDGLIQIDNGSSIPFSGKVSEDVEEVLQLSSSNDLQNEEQSDSSLELVLYESFRAVLASDILLLLPRIPPSSSRSSRRIGMQGIVIPFLFCPYSNKFEQGLEQDGNASAREDSYDTKSILSDTKKPHYRSTNSNLDSETPTLRSDCKVDEDQKIDNVSEVEHRQASNAVSADPLVRIELCDGTVFEIKEISQRRVEGAAPDVPFPVSLRTAHSRIQSQLADRVFVNNYSLAGLLVHRSQLLASVPQLEADLLRTSNELDAFSAEMMELEGIYEERLETLRDLEKQVAFISREKVKLDRDAAMLRDKKDHFAEVSSLWNRQLEILDSRLSLALSEDRFLVSSFLPSSTTCKGEPDEIRSFSSASVEQIVNLRRRSSSLRSSLVQQKYLGANDGIEISYSSASMNNAINIPKPPTCPPRNIETTRTFAATSRLLERIQKLEKQLEENGIQPIE